MIIPCIGHWIFISFSAYQHDILMSVLRHARFYYLKFLLHLILLREWPSKFHDTQPLVYTGACSANYPAFVALAKSHPLPLCRRYASWSACSAAEGFAHCTEQLLPSSHPGPIFGHHTPKFVLTTPPISKKSEDEGIQVSK